MAYEFTARRARVEIRATPLTLMPHHPGESGRAALVLTLLEVRETDAPQGDEPLHWLLYNRYRLRGWLLSARLALHLRLLL